MQTDPECKGIPKNQKVNEALLPERARIAIDYTTYSIKWIAFAFSSVRVQKIIFG